MDSLLVKDYFELFDLKKQYSVDLAELKRIHQTLLQATHPDRHLNQGAEQERMALQVSAHVNSAYETLASPLLRAQYLLNQSGLPTDFTSVTINDAQFLMEQMQWRESLGEIAEQQDEPALETLTKEVKQYRQNLLDDILNHFNQNELSAAQTCVSKLYFVDKMLRSIDEVEDQLDL